MTQKLPQGSLILVTGANGFIGSHVCDQLLAAGYRVRGTMRDLERSAWVSKYFEDKYGSDQFYPVRVADITQPGSLNEAIKGVSALAHVASDMNFDPDPNKSVTPVVNAVEYALRAAAGEPTCKSVVLTSSSTAMTLPNIDRKVHINTETWNEPAIRDAWADSYTDAYHRTWSCYSASKAQGEQRAWKFVEENKPHFNFNTILPNANFGPILNSKEQHGSVVGWVMAMYKPESFQRITNRVKPQWYVHVLDTARLHVACLTDLKYNGERLLAFGEPFNWNDILDILKRVKPSDDLPERWEGDQRDQTTVANERALEVLRNEFGQSSWTSLEVGVKDAVDSYR